MTAIASQPDSQILQVGPMDPDNTAELTQRYGVANNSLELLAGQADNQPPELMAALALPPDQDGRSDALVRDEVIRKAGDLLTREGTTLRSAYVRGGDDVTRVVTITYTVASGRVAKALLGAWSTFPQSVDAFEQVRRAKMGFTAGLAQLTSEEAPPASSPEAESLRSLVEEMQAELAELRNPEPVPGYRELNARDAAQRVYDLDASQLGAVERYEAASHASDDSPGRKSVLNAVDKRRADLEQQQADLAALKSARDQGRDPFAEPEGDS